MSFESIIGHASVVRILRRASERDRMHHAYLFSGPDGVGKELVAVELFKLLNCQRRASQPCDDCKSCRKIDADAEASRGDGDAEELAGTFADLMILRPAGQFIKIDQVRSVTKRLPYAPVEGRTKCVLIRDAHRLHETAANALLKTLEEPPPATLFVLTTANPHLLLTTIISRCQPVRFGALPREDVLRYLEERAGLDRDTASPLAAMSGGSIGKALELLNNPVMSRRRDWLAEVCGLDGRRDHDIFGMAESMAGERQHIPLYLDILRSWFRDQLLLLEGASTDGLTNVELVVEVQAAARRSDRRALLDSLERIDTVERALRGNANNQLTLDWMLMHLFGQPALG